GLADLSEAAWRKRLRACNAWLLWRLSELIAAPDGAAPPLPGAPGRIVLVDASTLGQPGGTGDDWRLHLAYDFTAGRLGQVRVTDRYGGERLAAFAPAPPHPPRPLPPGDGRREALRRAGVAAGGRRRRPGVARLVPVGAAALWRAAARDAAVVPGGGRGAGGG